jgi:uncharacterized protein YgbK (DUF1537 family)
MTLAVAMIADDLTGALDASAPFAMHGLRTIVACTPDAIDRALGRRPDVICVNTTTREMDASAAATRVLGVARRLAAEQPRIAFKKIDSRLKGPIAAELAACLEGFAIAHAAIAPAIPELGRVVRGGGLTGRGVAAPIDIAERIGSDVHAIPDTPDQPALDAVASFILEAPEPILAAGARGLATAFAAALGNPVAARDPLPLPRPLIIAIGSRDPITREQVAALGATAQASVVAAPHGHLPEAAAAADVALLLTTEAEIAEPIDVVARRFGAGVAAWVRARPPAALLISGGETAASVLAALQIDLLEVVGEALPGIPYCRAEIAGRDALILTKSGGFGDRDVLMRLAGRAPAPVVYAES